MAIGLAHLLSSYSVRCGSNGAYGVSVCVCVGKVSGKGRQWGWVVGMGRRKAAVGGGMSAEGGRHVG